MATQADVRALHEANPRASAIDIAAALDCDAGYVRATARRLRLPIRASSRPESIESLGRAAQQAGMTLADIAAWSVVQTQRSDNAKHTQEARTAND